MSYTSITFLYFLLPLTLLAHSIVPFRWKNSVLLIASIVFFAWTTPLLPLFMLIGVLFSYLMGILLDRVNSDGNRKLILVIGIAAALIPIPAQLFWKNIPLHLMAFSTLYSLHSISYLTEVYRREAQAQTSFSALGVYLTMYPHALAGPIIRYDDLRPVLTRRSTDIDRAAEGIWRFVVGLGKKVLLADRLFILCKQADALTAPGAAAIWLKAGAFCAAFWMAFSGCCDMAIGLGKMFGFDLPENFSRPFSALSLQEFSRRWNMTLSAWMREHFLNPLFGHRSHLPPIAIFLTSVLSAFFYGGRLPALLWGCAFGLLLIGERFLWGRFIEKLPRFLRRTITLLLIALSSMLLASDSVIGAIHSFGAMFGRNGLGLGQAAYLFSSYWPILLFCAFCATRWSTLLAKFITARPRLAQWLRLAAMLALLVCCTAYMI